MTRERFNQHMESKDLSEKVFNAARDGNWPVCLSKDLVLVQDQEFGYVYAAVEEELDTGLYTVVRSNGTIENVIVGCGC